MAILISALISDPVGDIAYHMAILISALISDPVGDIALGLKPSGDITDKGPI